MDGIQGEPSTASVGIAPCTSESSQRGCWWREAEALLLVAMVSVTYFTRLTALPICGEESRRGRVAVEMLESGDWLVPHLQGQLYFSRPPLQNWAIAVAGMLRGEVDAVAIRAPSAVAILATVLLIYAYGRSFLSRGAALAAAIGFASMLEVLRLGRLGESEAIFTALLGGALLVWHWGYSRRWSPAWTWSASYLLAALATLTKGPQAPVYFCGAVGVFLVLRRDWRMLVSPAHLAGICVFVCAWGAWHFPYQATVGWAGTLKMYTQTTGQRFEDSSLRTIITHVLTFPAENLGCLLPWSALLVAFFWRDFRRRIAPWHSHILYVACCVAVAFPTCWFVPMGRTRYLMPLCPCVACLAGLVLDRLWATARNQASLWTWFLRATAAVALAAGLGVAAIAVLGPAARLGLHPATALAYVAVSGVLAVALYRARHAESSRPRAAAVVAVAGFFAVTYVIVVLDLEVGRSEHSAPASVAELKDRLPEGTRLVSLGRLDHLFTYHFRDPIEVFPAPSQNPPLGPQRDYFCCNSELVDDLDFPYETVAIINCERNREAKPKRFVLVGRLLPSPNGESALESEGPLVTARAATDAAGTSPPATRR